MWPCSAHPAAANRRCCGQASCGAAVGALPGSETWHQVILRPGEHPRFKTGNLSNGRRLVVAVDQFEELFTACESEEERRSFVDALVEAAWDPERRVAILIAMRADYFGRLVAFPDLAELIGAGHVLLGPMSERELRRAIEGPADRAGLVVEPELVEALVADTAGESGGLPLLSTALLELWLERDGSTMRAASYEATGRVPAAVARLAETAYGRLDGTSGASCAESSCVLPGTTTACSCVDGCR